MDVNMQPIFLSSRKGQDCLDYLRSCNHWTCDKQATQVNATCPTSQGQLDPIGVHDKLYCWIHSEH